MAKKKFLKPVNRNYIPNVLVNYHIFATQQDLMKYCKGALSKSDKQSIQGPGISSKEDSPPTLGFSSCVTFRNRVIQKVFALS